MRKANLTLTDACITDFSIEHNGYQGGDAGHGGYVEIEIMDGGSTCMMAGIQTGKAQNELRECSSIKIRFEGDAERGNLIKGLEFILAELKTLEAVEV